MQYMFVLNQTVEIKKISVPLETMLKLNLKAKVPAHRTLHSFISHSASFPTSKIGFKTNAAFDKIDLSKFGISWAEIFKSYYKEFNTDFEEMTCLGLNNDQDMLGAVFMLKSKTDTAVICARQGVRNMWHFGRIGIITVVLTTWVLRKWWYMTLPICRMKVCIIMCNYR